MNKPGAIKFRRSQPSHREGDDDDLGISKLECPYAAEVDCDEKKPRSLPFSKRNWVAYMRTGPDAVVFWLGVTLATLVIFSGDTIQQINDYNYDNNKSYERRLTTIGPERIIFNTVHDQTASLWFHQHWKKLSISYGKPDYGNLIFESVVPVDQGRLFEKTREEFLESIDEKVDSSYSPGEDREDEDPRCRLPSWTDYTFPTCNQVHELLIERAFDQEVGQDFNVSYLK